MKSVLPCPICQSVYRAPIQVSPSAKLRCPACGHIVSAGEIIVDDSSLLDSWKLVEGTEPGGTASAESSSHAAMVPAIPEGLTSIAASSVPHSNEWETQSSTMLIDEASVVDQPHRDFEIDSATKSPAADDEETEASPDDRMLGVSDEPWISQPASETDSEFEATSPFDEASSESFDQEPSESEPLELAGEAEETEFAWSAENASILLDEEPSESQASDQGPSLFSPDQVLNSTSLKRSSKKSPSTVRTLLSVIGGGFAAIPISVLLMWYLLGTDPFEVGPFVSNFVPWIVPQAFQGESSSRILTTPNPTSNVAASNGNFPPIGGMASSSVSDANLPPSSSPSSSSATVPMADTSVLPGNESDPNHPSVSVDAPTASSPSPDAPAVTASPSSEGKMAEATPSDDTVLLPFETPAAAAVNMSLGEVEQAIDEYDPEKPRTSKVLFEALRDFGKKLSQAPAKEDSHLRWTETARDLCARFIDDDAAIKSIVGEAPLKSGPLKVEPGEIWIDYFLLESTAPIADKIELIAVEGKRFRRELNGIRMVMAPTDFPLEPHRGVLVIGQIQAGTKPGVKYLQVFVAVPRS